GTWDEVAALVAGKVFALDSGEASDGGRGCEEGLPAGEGALAFLGDGDRVPFSVEVAGVGVDLVEEEVADWHGAEAGGGVGAGEDDEAAGEFLDDGCVPGVAAAGFSYPSAERWGCFDHGREALFGDALGEFDGWLDDQGRRGGVADDVAEPVVPGFGLCH